MADLFEKIEITEQKQEVIITNDMEATDYFCDISRELEKAGNHDMAQYYAKKAEMYHASGEASNDIRLGGWHAGYTAGEWRDMAKKEYVKNGNSPTYKRYCDNAVKASD